jgi:hypothetical protein
MRVFHLRMKTQLNLMIWEALQATCQSSKIVGSWFRQTAVMTEQRLSDCIWMGLVRALGIEEARILGCNNS